MNHLSLIKVTSFFLTLFVLSTHAAEYKAYIIAGQSNAQGYGYADGDKVRDLLKPNTNLAEAGRKDLLEKNPDIQIFHGAIDSGEGAWKPLDAGCGICWNGTRFGPELSFGHKVQKELGGKVALIKYAKGGTSLAERSGDGKKKDSDDWYLLDDVENQYDFFIKTVKDAMVAAKEQGMFWIFRDCSGCRVKQMRENRKAPGHTKVTLKHLSRLCAGNSTFRS